MENNFPEHAVGPKLQDMADKTMFTHQPNFIINSFPRSGNTFLHVAVRMSWPHLVIQSHIHDPALYDQADGSVPFVSIVRNPEDALVSWMIHTLGQEIELSGEIEGYRKHLEGAKANKNVLILPFNEVTLNTQSVLEKSFNLPKRNKVDTERLLFITKVRSREATVDEERFSKQGHVPRDKHPMYDTFLAIVRSNRYVKDMEELNNLYNDLIGGYDG
jgi:hypothetical protein